MTLEQLVKSLAPSLSLKTYYDAAIGPHGSYVIELSLNGNAAKRCTGHHEPPRADGASESIIRELAAKLGMDSGKETAFL
jgi:hypothetical protein